jgi:hypothetical protein
MISLFTGLNAPQAQGMYSVAPVSGHVRYRIGKDNEGRPSLLIRPSKKSRTHLTIEAKHINVGFGQLCDIDSNGKPVRERITIARCVGTDPLLQRYFLSVCESIIIAIGDDPTDGEIESGFRSLLELFAQLEQASKKTAMGLWSELLLIVGSVNVPSVCDAWQRSGREVFDFHLNDVRIEVKSTGADTRIHHFRLPQLSPPGDVQVLVASIHAVDSAGGTTVSELAEEINSLLIESPDVRIEFESKLAQVMGANFEAILRASFDRELAQRSILLFDGKNVPKISEDTVPPGVSSVSFKSDLSGVPPYIPPRELQCPEIISAMGFCSE